MSISAMVERAWKARQPRSRLSIHAIREAELAEIREQNNARTYGWNGTIHGTEALDVEIGPDGRVIAVWFRCQMLPFNVSHVSHARNIGTTNAELPRIMAVEVIDR
jgi:hypothetical protein